VSNSQSAGGSYSTNSTTIPPTIHGSIGIGNSDGIKVNPSSLPATQPFSQFPTGNFLYQINATPFRFGLVRVEATVVEITSEYV
jgi:hypothetical protein